MRPQEILPPPENIEPSEAADSVEFTDEQSVSRQVERNPAVSAGQGALSGAMLGGAQAQIQQQTQIASGGQATQDDTADLPIVAEDVDLIEKEWVLRAKAIVAATMGDPHAQSIQINRMKADYIKKRYNRDLKLKDD